MAFQFLDSLFNIDPRVRLKPTNGNIYKLEELDIAPLRARSYVELALDNGFVVKHDENFRVKNIFGAKRGIRSKSDFIVVSNLNGRTEYLVVELKARNYQIEKVRNQFICGTAMAEYCRRLGVDHEGDVARFLNFDVYAVVLTNTVSEHKGTGINHDPTCLAFKKKCGPGTGVLCVNGHSVTLDQLRRNSIHVDISFSACNKFDTVVPYPGGPDEMN